MLAGMLALIAASLGPANVARGAEIVVGLAVPLTGRMGPVGLAMQTALEAAVSEINRDGTLGGDTLLLRTEDDGCAAATAEGAAQRLIGAGARLVIGHPCSNAAVASAPVYGRAGVLLIAVGARHPDVTRVLTPAAAAPALRLAGRDDTQGKQAASWLFDNAPQGRMAIVHDRTSYARTIAENAARELTAAGKPAVAEIGIVAGRHDYAEAVRALRDSAAECLVFAGYEDEAEILIGALGAAGMSMPVLGTDALATRRFGDFAQSAKNRIQVLVPIEISPRIDGDKVVLDEGDAQSLRARGALEAWVQAAQRAGTTDGATLAQAMRGPLFMTRSVGEIQFDANGDLVLDAFAPASPRDGAWVSED